MGKGYRKFITPIFVLNIVFQSFISLASPIAVGLLIAWLLNTKLAVGGWIYAILVLLGALSGFYSMIVFILKACRSLEAIDKQNREKEKQQGLKK